MLEHDKEERNKKLLAEEAERAQEYLEPVTDKLQNLEDDISLLRTPVDLLGDRRRGL